MNGVERQEDRNIVLLSILKVRKAGGWVCGPHCSTCSKSMVKWGIRNQLSIATGACMNTLVEVDMIHKNTLVAT